MVDLVSDDNDAWQDWNEPSKDGDDGPESDANSPEPAESVPHETPITTNLNTAEDLVDDRTTLVSNNSPKQNQASHGHFDSPYADSAEPENADSDEQSNDAGSIFV